ncbi:MAG: hypothetical protein HYV02_08945, partial [Deltaproteobacteria bacterium]|nr:hypothetical protein [Deltaproteobacteria bacterium]
AGAAGVFAATAPAALGSAATALPAPYATTPGDCAACDPALADGETWLYFDADGDGYGGAVKQQCAAAAIHDPQYLYETCLETYAAALLSGEASGSAAVYCEIAALDHRLQFVPNQGDCHQFDPRFHNGLSWFPDMDGDELGDASVPPVVCAFPVLGGATPEVCLNSRFAFPGCRDMVLAQCLTDADSATCEALESKMQWVTNGSDCNTFDATNAGTFLKDQDGDGFGDAQHGYCTQPATVPVVQNFLAFDCDDTKTSVGPPTTMYADDDGDGLGDPILQWSLCPGEYLPYPGQQVASLPNDGADYMKSPSAFESLAINDFFWGTWEGGFVTLCRIEEYEDKKGYSCIPKEYVAPYLPPDLTLPVLGSNEFQGVWNGSAEGDLVAEILYAYFRKPVILQNASNGEQRVLFEEPDSIAEGSTQRLVVGSIGGEKVAEACISLQGLLGGPLPVQVVSPKTFTYTLIQLKKTSLLWKVEQCARAMPGVYQVQVPQQDQPITVVFVENANGQGMQEIPMPNAVDAVPLKPLAYEYFQLFAQWPKDDTDADWLGITLEELVGLDPSIADTDGDGASDGAEYYVAHHNVGPAKDAKQQIVYSDKEMSALVQTLSPMDQMVWNWEQACALQNADIFESKIRRLIPEKFYGAVTIKEAVAKAMPAYLTMVAKNNPLIKTTTGYLFGATLPSDEIYIDLHNSLLGMFKKPKGLLESAPHLPCRVFLHEAAHVFVVNMGTFDEHDIIDKQLSRFPYWSVPFGLEK